MNWDARERILERNDLTKQIGTDGLDDVVDFKSLADVVFHTVDTHQKQIGTEGQDEINDLKPLADAIVYMAYIHQKQFTELREEIKYLRSETIPTHTSEQNDPKLKFTIPKPSIVILGASIATAAAVLMFGSYPLSVIASAALLCPGYMHGKTVYQWLKKL